MTASASPLPLENSLGYWLRRASVRMMGDLGKLLSDLDLTVVEATLLVLVDTSPGVAQSELGRELGIKSANMAPLTARLIARDLLSRSWLDGRSQALTCTKAGSTLASKASRRMRDYEDIQASLIPENVRQAMLTALTSMARRP